MTEVPPNPLDSNEEKWAKKPRVALSIIIGWGASYIAGISALLGSLNPKYFYAGIVLFVLANTAGAFAVRITLLNYGCKKKPVVRAFYAFTILTACLASWLAFDNHKSRQLAERPFVTPKEITLFGSDEYFENIVEVINPNDIPLFNVMVEIELLGANINPYEVDVRMLEKDALEPKQTNYPGTVENPLLIKGHTYRLDYFGEHSDNRIFYVIGHINAKDSRRFDVGGKESVVSSAKLSVFSYMKEAAVRRQTNSWSLPLFQMPVHGVWDLLEPDFSTPWAKYRMIGRHPNAMVNWSHLKLATNAGIRAFKSLK